jgi:cephalosporin-C deacetylase
MARYQSAVASNLKANKDGEVSSEVKIHDKNAIFSETASFTFSVKNTLDTDQSGTVSYLITTEHGEKVTSKSISVKVGKNSSADYDFSVPDLKAGFYKINFMINVNDYDDTTKCAFGIRPQEIQSKYPKPADFDQFWQTTKDELAKIAPNYRVTKMPKLSTENRYVYLIEMQSLDNITIRGWMSLPKSVDKNKKFAVSVALPGYQVPLNPIVGADDDLAIIALNVRGQGNSRDVIATRKDEYISYHVEDKNKYIMRGVVMDCLRCIDFICSRPELRHDNIMVSGGSMGGLLAIATASLDKRVQLCSVQNPILSDIRDLVGEVDWPISSIKKYVATQPGLTIDKVFNNLDYFDTKNFAYNVTCSTLMGIGLLDPLAPPNSEYAAYNNFGGKKRIMIFKNIGHEVDHVVYKGFESRWLHDEFALF